MTKNQEARVHLVSEITLLLVSAFSLCYAWSSYQVSTRPISSQRHVASICAAPLCSHLSVAPLSVGRVSLFSHVIDNEIDDVHHDDDNLPFIDVIDSATELKYTWEDDSIDDTTEGYSFSDEGDDSLLTIQVDPLVKEFEQWNIAVEKCLDSLSRKQSSLERELLKAQSSEATFRRAQLLTNHLYAFPKGIDSAVVYDWENGGEEITLTLDPGYDSAQAEVEALFSKAKKLKRGSLVVQSLLEETSHACEIIQDIKLDLEGAIENGNFDEGTLRLIQGRLIRCARMTQFEPPARATDTDAMALAGASSYKSAQQRQRKPPLGSPASNIRKLNCPNECCTVLVGRNRRGNEYISMTLARQNDIWMHARGCPGAHILVQPKQKSHAILQSSKHLPKTGRRSRRLSDNGKNLDQSASDGFEDNDEKENDIDNEMNECLQFAANLAIFYSDARSERKAPVTLAESKHILKPRNAPLGAVKLRQEMKVLIGFPDDVPSELKDARQESGLTDEYRAVDKAKHRRRTQAAAKQKKKSSRQNG